MSMKSLNTHIRKRLSKNIDGDILGMPLYLFIVIVVTVIGLGILLAWLALIDDPPTTLEAKVTPITIYIYDDGAHGDGAAGDDIYANNALDITVIVKDNNGDKVNGASVSLDGMSIEDGAGGSEVSGWWGPAEADEAFGLLDIGAQLCLELLQLAVWLLVHVVLPAFADRVVGR